MFQGSTMVACLHGNGAAVDFAVGIDNFIWSNPSALDFYLRCVVPRVCRPTGVQFGGGVARTLRAIPHASSWVSSSGLFAANTSAVPFQRSSSSKMLSRCEPPAVPDASRAPAQTCVMMVACVSVCQVNMQTLLQRSAATLGVTPSQARFNVYLYDGDHAEQSHYDAFAHFVDVLDDVFIAIVDDWNWDYVKHGTRRAFDDLNLQVLWEHEVASPANGDDDSWWNGYYVAVVAKPTGMEPVSPPVAE